MSINVTVHGNPISINRGKMVALDNNKEFELRRKIRIQQVRQQSKRIAEEVRNKVRKEKCRQLNKFDKEAEADYKNKQNRKLTCLKQHYRSGLSDFGKAFGDAENEPDQDTVISQIEKENRCQAEERGRIAQQKSHYEKEKEAKELQKQKSNKKYARYVENLRSKLVTDLSNGKKNKKKRKKHVANIVINGEMQLTENDCSSDSDASGPEKHNEVDCSESKSSNESICIPCKENAIDEATNVNLSDEKHESHHLNLPVCGPKSSNNNTTYNSHENYHHKSRSSKKTSGAFSTIPVNSLNKNNDESEDYSESPCYGAPCRRVLENITDSQSSVSDLQKTNYSVNNYKNGSKPKVFVPVSPAKPVFVKRQIVSSPDRTIPRKMLISNNESPKISTKDLEDESLEIVCPIKIERKKAFKKSPKKLNRKPSSIHDTNYCLPTFVNKFKKSSCEHDMLSSSNNFDRQEASVSKNALPTFPRTIIRPDIEKPLRQTNVAYYDRFNKFCKEESQPAVVQKISKESIDIVSDHDDSDMETQDMICKKREQNAKQRGNRALEKVKIQQDYQKLLQELPILQRQERLANMPVHKPTLHMSNERYQEYERKKQNAMDNKFENMQAKAVQFDKPPVTLKSVRKIPCSPTKSVPLKTLDITDENAVNVGSWQNEPSPSSEQHLPTEEESPRSTSSEADIADLLKRVNKQRELLIKEAVNMKSLGPLKDILNTDELINIICSCPPRQKLLIETGTSPLHKDTTKASSSKQRIETKSPKRTATSSSDTSIESKPKSKTSKIKPKVKKLKVFLREEATQTSPALSKKSLIETKEQGRTSPTSHSVKSHKSQKSKSSSNTKKRPSSKKSSEKIVPKTASIESSTEKSDKVCEIIIRTGEQNVKINPLTGETKCEPNIKKGSPKKDMVVKIKETNGLEVSTSTSYLSPPIELKGKGVVKELSGNKGSMETIRPSNRHLLQPQKQQTNLDNLVRTENGKKQINPRLVKYILRLLNMSRQSIDELTISSVSDVSTPHDSLIMSANNVARDKLQTVMEHFNLSLDDIKRLCLSTSSFSDTTVETKKHDHEQDQTLKPCTCSSQQSPKNDSKRELDVCESTSTLNNYEESKSKVSKSPKNSPRIYSETQDSTSAMHETKGTTTQGHSSSRSSRPSSPSYKTVKSPPKGSPKHAVPKMDSTSDPYSTERTTIPSSKQQSNLHLKSPTKKLVVPKCPTTGTTSSDELMLKDPKKFLQFVRESLGMSEEEFSELGFQEMFSRHLELTEYCHDRIRSLMSLIEQIRNEKREICSAASPVDHSMTLTSYLELPSKSKHQDEEYDNSVKNCLESDISSGTSISQEAIDTYLLGLGSDDEIVTKEKKNAKRLKSGESKDETDKQSFVPMLQGIPKYNESKSVMSNYLGNILQEMKPKPPPALLRSNMRGHTNEIPHELSTIPEADTFLSSRNTSMQRARSPEERIPSKQSSPRKICLSPKEDTKTQKQSLSPKSDKKSPKKKEKSLNNSSSPNSSAAYITISPERATVSSGSKDKQQKRTVTPESSDATKSGISGIQSLSETSESDELEMLLRKFKLEWAISLVKKTEQALALSSSSSSSEIRGKKDVSSDYSVRESFREMCKKLASMNESDVERAQIVSDLSQHFREFHEISEIGGMGDSKNKSQQRTSTPVQHSKSTESKKSIINESLFKVDSELSSVKNSSGDTGDPLFLSIPNVTLNTEHISLIKS